MKLGDVGYTLVDSDTGEFASGRHRIVVYPSLEEAKRQSGWSDVPRVVRIRLIEDLLEDSEEGVSGPASPPEDQSG